MRCIRADLPLAALAVAVLMALPIAGLAQSAPAASSTAPSMATPTMPAMDHSHMPGMVMPPAPSTVAPDSHQYKAVKKPAAPTKPATHSADMDHAQMDHGATPGRSPAPLDSDDHAAMSGMDHSGMNHAPVTGTSDGAPSTPGSMPAMDMGAMQGGSAPPGARSPDYSDGVGYGPMKPHLHGNDAVGMLLLDQLEAVHGRSGNAQAWEVQAWYGRDENKLWLRSEGELSKGKVEDGNVEVLWNHAIAAYWGSELGMRHDFGAGPGRDWLAFGVQGLAPYWFDVAATAYVGSAGRTAARLRADYEVLFTQRLILQPELELNLYGKNDPARGVGRGLSDVQFGLRLRYEIRREFAPYVGINWVRRVGTSADFARAAGQPVFDQQFVAGFRIWF